MLQAGQEPGTTDIIVTANNSIPIHLTLDYNNFGSRYVSSSRFGATFDVANLLKEGSILSMRGISGINPDESLFGRISYSIPLNNIGTRLGFYYHRGGFDVGREFAVLNMTGRTEAAGFFVTHPYIKKRSTSLIAEVGFDLKNTRQVMLDTVTSRDKIRSVRAGVSYESTDTSGRTSASLYITQGLGHTLDAMPNNYYLSSRLGADNGFTKANLDLLRLQRIVPSVFLILKASGQWAGQSLVAGEQFAIGGADSVRGYPQSEYSGDDGYSATAEFRVSPLADREIFQLAFFVDNGAISVKDPVPGQHKNRSLTGGGGGIRLNLPKDFNVRADVGIPLDPSHGSDGRNAVFYLQAVKRF
jgi:hemolysin activation/secretion protein